MQMPFQFYFLLSIILKFYILIVLDSVIFLIALQHSISYNHSPIGRFRLSLIYCYYFSLIFNIISCGILVPQPEIILVPPALEAQSPTHWSQLQGPRKPLLLLLSYSNSCTCARASPAVDRIVIRGQNCRVIGYAQLHLYWKLSNDIPT